LLVYRESGRPDAELLTCRRTICLQALALSIS
jgi:hypothetical protein